MADSDKSGGLAELIIKVTTALGANENRMRWRMKRLGNRWRNWTRRSEQRVDHIRYQHKVCPECTAVQDRGEKTCSSCGASLGSRRWQVLERIGLTAPELLSASSLLGVALIVVYARVMFAQTGGSAWNLELGALIDFGGNFKPATQSGQWWRLLTATVLHAGIWHIGFNLIALSIVGPRVEELYGRFVMFFWFALTGAAASLGSTLLGPDGGVSIGASGGLMGLVGIAAAWGHRDGTTSGKAVRDLMIKWAVFVMILGFFIGADNWAHAVGLASGAAIGLTIDPRHITKRAHRRIPLALIGTAVMAATVYLALRPPELPIAFRDTPVPERPELEAMDDPFGDWWKPIAKLCDREKSGDRVRALADYRTLAERLGVGPYSDDNFDRTCADLEHTRYVCGRVEGDDRRKYAALCAAVGAPLAVVPPT